MRRLMRGSEDIFIDGYDCLWYVEDVCSDRRGTTTLVLGQQEGSLEPEDLYLEVTEYGEVLRELYDYDV